MSSSIDNLSNYKSSRFVLLIENPDLVGVYSAFFQRLYLKKGLAPGSCFYKFNL